MGLFTDKCPQCGYRVRKGSKFCPGCGQGAPKGVVLCGSCGKEVRSSAKHCWNCGTELATVTPTKFTSNRWARTPEDVATRVDEEDLHGWLVKPLIIEHGTRALFFQGGRYAGELSAGSYDVGGFAARIKKFLIDRPASIVLVDAGDVPLDLENGQLWTADGVEVGTRLRLVVQIQDPEALFVNYIKGRGHITVDDVEHELASEAQMVLKGIVARQQVETLFNGFDLRYELETHLRQHLGATLQRLGLQLGQLRFVEFVGEAYEKLRAQRTDLSATEERLRLAQRLREVLTQEQMHEFKSAQDFAEFVRQAEHELGLKTVIREDELQRLKQRFEFERDREQLVRRIEIEAIANDGHREEAWKDLVAEERAADERHERELQRNLKAATNEAEITKFRMEIKRLEHAEEVRQAEEGLRLLERVKGIEQHEADLEQTREERRLRAFSDADARALIAILDGPAAERVESLERFRMQQTMSPEQLLALAASAAPEAARALAAKYTAEGQVTRELVTRLEQQLAEQRTLSEGYADRLERVLHTALQEMGQVATTRARAVEPQQTVVVPGGPAAPVVINPPASQASAPCQHCGAPVERGATYCPACGKRL